MPKGTHLESAVPKSYSVRFADGQWITVSATSKAQAATKAREVRRNQGVSKYDPGLRVTGANPHPKITD